MHRAPWSLPAAAVLLLPGRAASTIHRHAARPATTTSLRQLAGGAAAAAELVKALAGQRCKEVINSVAGVREWQRLLLLQRLRALSCERWPQGGSCRHLSEWGKTPAGFALQPLLLGCVCRVQH